MNELPKGWQSTNFDSLISRIVGGGTPSKSNTAFFQGHIPFMTVKDMKERFPSDTIDHISDEAVEYSPTTVVPADTLIIATRMSLGKIVRPRFETAINQDLKALFLAEGIDKTFIEYWWHSRSNLIQELGTGTTVKGIRLEDIRSLSIDVPPANEQQRIVNRLDDLFERVHVCRNQLDHVSLILKRFRDSVLSAATSGELTKDWRNGEDTSGWLHERAEEVCSKVQSGGTPKEGFIREPGIPFLKVYNIVDQKIDFEYRPQFVSELLQKGSLAKSCTKPNDVLMNIVGPPLGKVAIVPNHFSEWNINQAITLFRPSEKITTGWLYYFLCSGTSVAEIFHETRGSAGQRNISLSQCRNFIFPVPPMEEQQEIVYRVKKLFDYADHVEAVHHSAYAQIEQLIPALLDKAFRGELVPQDPNDEPASVLLERIRTERAAQPIAPKRILTNRKPTMTKISTESIKEIIHQLPMDMFSFDDLRENIPGDYDSLKDILFGLLDESEPSIMQVFDQEAKIMQFVKGNK